MKHDINRYVWRGIDALGNKCSGIIEASTRESANKTLMTRDITVLTIRKNNFSNPFFSPKPIQKKELLDMTQQLALLLQAGIPLVDALMLIEKITPNQALKKVILSLSEKINRGDSFSAALKTYPIYFNRLYCQLIFAGEQTGNLDLTLSQLVDHLTAQSAIHHRIAKAFFYPLCVLCLAILISIGLIIFVIPQFNAIYSNFGATLPLLTRVLITISYYFMHWGISLFFGIIATSILIKMILKRAGRFMQVRRKFVLKIPLLKSIILTQQIAQWSQLLTITLSAHLPLIDALSIANDMISVEQLRDQLQRTKEALISGKSFHSALDYCTHFPLRAKQLIAIGENADALDTMMKRIADIYEQELKDLLEHLSKLIEPVMMVSVSVFIGTLIIGMYLPIFRMGSVI